MILLYIFLAILVIKLLINISRYLQSKWYLSKYYSYLKKTTWKFSESTHQILKLFKDAGVEDSTITYVEPVGYGRIINAQPSVFQNITYKREDVVHHVLQMFHQAIGTYRSRIIETINPLYWLEVLIFLPKYFLNYLGVPPEKTIIKVFQIIYWIVVTTSSILFGIFRGNIELVIKNWLTKLIIP